MYVSKLTSNRGWITLNIAIWFGFASLLYYLAWWLTLERLRSPLLLFLFLCATVYCTLQLAATWMLYLAAHRSSRRKLQQLDQPLTVDVFVTSYDEDPALIEKCLRAARDMSGPHLTWLLDDASREEVQAIAEKLGVGYLTREGNLHHKAGNINAALKQTVADIVVIFDVDHVPTLEFLDYALGYFNDPRAGFVQVMLTFTYKNDSPTSKAASESSLDFYNPASLGADALGAATLIGSNALIRRTALDSIGGYQPGLAEDLASSIALHATGWTSFYVNRPLAPGLAPPDLEAWFDQQFKWSRGVYELLFTRYASCWPLLTWGQRLSYAVRMTYYWIGVLVAAHLLATIIVLFLATQQQMAGYSQYIVHCIPIAVATVVIRGVALRHHASASVKMFFETPVYLQWKPLMLVLGTWPTYTLGWFLTLFRVPTAFRPTPKEATGHGPKVVWLLPQLVASLALLLGVVVRAAGAQTAQSWLVLAFAVVLALSQVWVPALAYMESRSKEAFQAANQVPEGTYREF